MTLLGFVNVYQCITTTVHKILPTKAHPGVIWPKLQTVSIAEPVVALRFLQCQLA